MKPIQAFKLFSQSLLFTLLLSLSFHAAAMNLQQAMSQLPNAKAQGLVGEQTNGYLGVVSNRNNAGEITKLINQARKSQYQKMAQENNIQLQDVEALAGKKAIEKTRPGHYIHINGKWRKK